MPSRWRSNRRTSRDRVASSSTPRAAWAIRTARTSRPIEDVDNALRRLCRPAVPATTRRSTERCNMRRSHAGIRRPYAHRSIASRWMRPSMKPQWLALTRGKLGLVGRHSSLAPVVEGTYLARQRYLPVHVPFTRAQASSPNAQLDLGKQHVAALPPDQRPPASSRSLAAMRSNSHRCRRGASMIGSPRGCSEIQSASGCAPTLALSTNTRSSSGSGERTSRWSCSPAG